MSHQSDIQVDLEALSQTDLLPELTVSVNSLENVSQFGSILSPTVEYQDFPCVSSFESLSTLSSSSLGSSVVSDGDLDDLDHLPPSRDIGLPLAEHDQVGISSRVLTSALTASARAAKKNGFKKNRKFSKKAGKRQFKSSAYGSKRGSSVTKPVSSSLASFSSLSLLNSSPSSAVSSTAPLMAFRTDSTKSLGPNTTRTGRWSSDEHLLFLQGIAEHGRNWDKVAKGVQTRTTVQVRSHAQKYFKKLAHREQRLADGRAQAMGHKAAPIDLSDSMIKKNAASEISGILLD